MDFHFKDIVELCKMKKNRFLSTLFFFEYFYNCARGSKKGI